MQKRNGYTALAKVGVFVTLMLGGAVLVLAFGADLDSRNWVLFGLGTAAVLLGGLRFFVEAVRDLKSRRVGQYFTGSLGLLVLVGYALSRQFVFGDPTAWWQPAVVAVALSLTHWVLRSLAARVARNSRDLVGQLPEFADRLDGNEIERVAVSEVEIGDILLVRPGAVVPVDAVVVQGSSAVDEALLTGEDFPVAKSEGSNVFAGTVNASAKKSNKAMTVRATALRGDLLVENFTRRVEELAAQRGLVDSVAAKLSNSLFVLTLASGFIAGGLWLVLDPSAYESALLCFAAVLLSVNLAVISGVSALVSSLVATVAGGRGALVRARTALYRVRKSHIVVMNLVGTLTMGEPKVVQVHLAKGTSLGSEADLLAVAGGVEARSDHALALAILAEARKRNVETLVANDIEPHRFGVSARIDGSAVLVGSAGILTAYNVDIDVNDFVKVASANERGNSVVYVVMDNLLVGFVEFHDEIRETAREAVTALHMQRKRVIALSGESAGVTESVCRSLGIVEHFAECNTARKLAVLDELRVDGSIITVVGDPFDDAEILAHAEVGIALGVGGELGAQSADVLVVSNEPRAVGRIMLLAKKSTSTVTATLVVVAALDVVGLALAGFVGQPLISAGVVLLSSMMSSAFILRLRRF